MSFRIGQRVRIGYGNPSYRRMKGGVEGLNKGTKLGSTTYEDLGVGIVVDEWGGWKACLNCYDEVHKCTCPKEDGHPKISINGDGIYDILFLSECHCIMNKLSGTLRCINQAWLVPA